MSRLPTTAQPRSRPSIRNCAGASSSRCSRARAPTTPRNGAGVKTRRPSRARSMQRVLLQTLRRRSSKGGPVGKSIDQLKLDETPFPAAEDPRQSDWWKFAEEIDELLGSGSYTWAEETLTDIQATVRKFQRVTEGQRKAVGNIAAARVRGGTRRYEGFQRWRR